MAESVTVTAKSAANAADSGKTKDVNFTEVVAASITIEPVGSNTAFVEHRVVKLKVTAQYDKGNAQPGAPIKLSATDVLNRQGDTFTSGKLLIDGGMIGTETYKTGADSTVIFNVTDPNGKGVKTTVNVLSGSAFASTDVIFKIITSPDTPLAIMYGHMTESVSGFRWPLLKSEATGSGSYKENNETGLGVTYTKAVAVCGTEANIPTKHDLINLQSSQGVWRQQQGGLPITSTVPLPLTFRSITGMWICTMVIPAVTTTLTVALQCRVTRTFKF